MTSRLEIETFLTLVTGTSAIAAPAGPSSPASTWAGLERRKIQPIPERTSKTTSAKALLRFKGLFTSNTSSGKYSVNLQQIHVCEPVRLFFFRESRSFSCAEEAGTGSAVAREDE